MNPLADIHPDDAWNAVLASNWLVTFAAADVKRIAFFGNAGNDTFINDTAIDVLSVGGEGDDVLSGGEGSDVLYGNDGADTLNGRGGRDELFGVGGTTRSLVVTELTGCMEKKETTIWRADPMTTHYVAVSATIDRYH